MKYLEAFLDNWFLPICLAVVSGWFLLRQKALFTEHKDMLERIGDLETGHEVMENELGNISATQQDIKTDVKTIVKTVTEIHITQEANKLAGNKQFLQEKM